MMIDLPINDIRTDGGTQSRVRIDTDYVDELVAAIEADATIPPIVVFNDGQFHWLGDGFHRYRAYTKAKHGYVMAEVRPGTQRDAILYSVGANQSHGLRRSNADKRRAVTVLLNDSEWAQWSNKKIADQCGVSHPFVGEIRSSLVTVTSENRRTYTTKHGTTATMDTSGIGRRGEPSDTDTDDAPTDTEGEPADLFGPEFEGQPQADPQGQKVEQDRQEPESTSPCTGEQIPRGTSSRGSLDDTLTMLESFKTIQEMLTALGPLQPKKINVMDVLEAARGCSRLVLNIIHNLEKGF